MMEKDKGFYGLILIRGTSPGNGVSPPPELASAVSFDFPDLSG